MQDESPRMSDRKNRQSKSKTQHQLTENTGGSQQPSHNGQPKDYPLVPLTNAIKDLKEAYAAALSDNTKQQEKHLLVQIFLCLFTAGAFVAAGWYAYIANG